MAPLFLPLIEENAFAKEYFRRVLDSGKLSHAYLLTGPDGSLLRRFSLELAKALQCEQGTACGGCAPCSAVEHGNHPNVHVFGPAEGKAIVDIDTIRALCERTHYRSTATQVAILERADLMNEPAANAILKTLEEPPGDAVLILTAQSAGSLLPTIVSRCHRLSVTGTSRPGPDVGPETLAALEDLASPGFFAREDLKAWLSRCVPEEESTRNAVRRLLDVFLCEWRSRLDGLEDLRLDDALRRLAVFLDLRADVDRGVNPDLILERLARTARWGA